MLRKVGLSVLAVLGLGAAVAGFGGVDRASELLGVTSAQATDDWDDDWDDDDWDDWRRDRDWDRDWDDRRFRGNRGDIDVEDCDCDNCNCWGDGDDRECWCETCDCDDWQ